MDEEPDEEPRPQTAASIEDNYPEYTEDSFGYAYEVDDVMSQRDLARRRRLLEADSDQLEALEPDQLDDFELWTLAHAWRRRGDFERFFELGRQLLRSESEHPVVIYSEISRGLAWEWLARERLDEAHELLEEHLERWPNDVEGRQLAGIVELLGDGGESGLRQLAAEYPADAELRFEIAEDLWRLGHGKKARKWVEKARLAAVESGDRSVIVDLELLEARIAKR